KKDDKKEEKPKPIVIDRYHFKQDVQGYLTGANRALLYLYDLDTQKLDQLAIVGADGTAPRILTAKLDRSVSTPRFSADGKTITVLVEDDRSEYPVAV